MNRHVPVLLDQTLEVLTPTLSDKTSAQVLDATFGGGGHTGAILRRFPFCHVMACDLDETAFERARDCFQAELRDDRLRFFHGNFKNLPSNPWSPDGGGSWNAILADLGYSSNQLEDAAYGMSFQKEAPLDMRLSRPAAGPTAWDVLCSATEEQLGKIFASYGEMEGAFRIARQLKEAIQLGAVVNSTLSLAQWMERKQPRRSSSSIHPATLVFQALRIAVNDELRSLDQFLDNAILKLKPGGLLLVITFHSLEDRIVKMACNRNALVQPLVKKPLIADERETQQNPRARSAKLRVYRKKGSL